MEIDRLPIELKYMIAESDRIAKAIGSLKAKEHLTIAELGSLAKLETEMIGHYSTPQLVRIDGKPKAGSSLD